MSALNARMSWRASSTVLPLIAALIIEVDAWLIEQPWPPIFTSATVPSSIIEVEDHLVAAQRVEALRPCAAGGIGSSPRFRGER